MIRAPLLTTLLAMAHLALQAAERPNIILVMADDQGWGDVAYQGHPTLKTPHLDDMARAGLRFDRFYAAAPVCSPTRGSVMTGRHPNRFGCFSWGHALRPQERTLAEALKTAGYRTGHFGKWHLGSVQNGSPVNPGASGFDEWLSAPNFFDNDPILSAQGKAVALTGESSLVTVDAALEFIRRQTAQSQPFFAVVWFGSPHLPHQALPEDRQLYPDEPETTQHFYGEITAMDRALGKLRDELNVLGIRQNTILWYCSDNGALPRGGSTGGHRGHKGSLYEGGLLVPAILEWPARIPTPRSTSLPCNTSDLYPTLLEIAGVSMKEQPILDGISLVPLLDGQMPSRPKPMGFWVYPRPGMPTPTKPWMTDLLNAQRQGREPDDPQKLRLDAGMIDRTYPEDTFPGHAAWTDGSWKLHRIADRSGQDIQFELYDLNRDRTESQNLLDQEPSRAAAMKTALEAWQHSVVRSLNGADYPSPPAGSSAAPADSSAPGFQSNSDPRVLRHVTIYRGAGRFAGWPANHGLWSWGNEILVGFSIGHHKNLGPDRHAIDRDKPEQHWFARSLDGGETWALEHPGELGQLVPRGNALHGRPPTDLPDPQVRPWPGPVDFTAPGFAMTLRMLDVDRGPSWIYFSTDKGHNWQGPFLFPDLGTGGIAARTDYIVNGSDDCQVFLTCAKADGEEGRPLCARTTDGGQTWRIQSYIGPEPAGFAIMPSTVRVSANELITAVRRREGSKRWIDAYRSVDNGESWELLPTPINDTGEGNPPSLIRLKDNRLCLTYGYRAKPFSIRARLSSDNGQSWGPEMPLRADGGGRDVGYVRSVQRPDGVIVTTYYFHDEPEAERYVAATLWKP